MQTFILYFALFGASLTVPAVVVLWLHEKGIRPLDEVMSRYRRLPVLVRILSVVAVVDLFVYGSTKTNQTGQVDGGTTNAPPSRTMARPQSGPSSVGFSPEQLAAGFVLVEARTNETWNFAKPSDATCVEAWLRRGAATDWALLDEALAATNAGFAWPYPLTVFSDGRLQNSRCAPRDVHAPLAVPLGVVPAANWSRIAGTNAQSRVWHGVTSSNSLVVTWQDVLLNREADSPVCVQAEFFENGNFVYRYDLSRAALLQTDPDWATNLVIGAWHDGYGAGLDVAALGFPPEELSSVFFQALEERDAVQPDRDDDGLTTYDEIFTWHTDPSLPDTDGDGLADGEEVARGTDPRATDTDGDGLPDGSDPDPLTLTPMDDPGGNGLPDAYENHWFGGTNVVDDAAARDATGFTPEGKMSAGVNPTNEPSASQTFVTNSLVGWKLWDSFSANWPSSRTNLVYERTIAVRRTSNWQHYYLSSRPDSAGGWSLDGLVLEWSDSAGASGTLRTTPVGDSVYLPLSTNNPSQVTFRLRATSSSVRSVTPVYLVAYSPSLEFGGGQKIQRADGTFLLVYCDGSQSKIQLDIDWSRRPCRATLSEAERFLGGLSDLSGLSFGEFAYLGDERGGRIVPRGAGVFTLPDLAVKGDPPRPRNRLLKAGNGNDESKVVVLSPSVWYGKDHCYGGAYLAYVNGEYARKTRYPLDSKCLRREWERDETGCLLCNCEPGASTGLPEDDSTATANWQADDEEVTAVVTVCGTEVWSGSARHATDLGCWHVDGLQTLDGCVDECDEKCTDGKCGTKENPSLASFKFRIPLGSPRKGQTSGFAYFDTETPMAITPDAFQFLFRDDAAVSVVTNGSARVVECMDARGRRLDIVPIAHGVRVTVSAQATGVLDHVWEIVNVDGDVNVTRLVKISRLDNVMEDWTYAYAYDDESQKWGWRATDNVTGICEKLSVNDGLNVDGSYVEVRTRLGRSGEMLDRREIRSEIIGEGVSAALRETSYREWTGTREIVRAATYWRDVGHRARNGRLKLLTANDRPWEYHEWDEFGRELLRVEQRNGSDVPSDFPVAAANGFECAGGLADAFLTTFDYAPLPGDDANSNDFGRVRCETRYVVRNGVPTMTGRTWHRLTHRVSSGFPTVRDEQERAAAPTSSPGDADNARSYREVIDTVVRHHTIPIVLRDAVVDELDEDGRRTASTLSCDEAVVRETRRTSVAEVLTPTYEIVETDAVYGNVLRTATCLTEGDAVIAEERSVYDDQNRLRSTTYLDGTSLTNAYSCCRKLWSRDRQGRTTLRSAQTGTDHLYYAEEETWLQDVSSNGFRVTQHFLDGFGRETNTVVYAGTVPGEATVASASDGKDRTESTAAFAGTGWDCESSVDARGKCSERQNYLEPTASTSVERSWSDDATGETRWDADTWNGPRVTRREWDGKWTERRTWDEYDADGFRVAYEVTESSDYGVITNSIRRYDFLGREVSEETPQGLTTRVYDGTTGRVIETAFAAEDVVRTTTNLYDVCGENVGTVVDDVVRRRETSYEERSNVWWKVTRESVVGSRTNATSVTCEQLTGLSDACRARTLAVSAAGVRTETTTSFDADTGLETRTAISSVGGTYVTVSRFGLVLSTSSDDGTTSREYDALGRVVCETRTVGTDETALPVRETEYNAFGDAVAVLSYTNGTDCVLETATYDAFGRCVEKMDGLGALTTMEYDAQGNLVGTDGATAPTRSTYDTEGRRTSLSTTRDGILWDVTTWEYDPGTGKCLKKRRSDGGETVRTYTPDGLEALVTRPSLQWRENIYDERRRLVGVVSNDGSENAAYGYDEFAQLTSASNAESVVAYARHRGGAATNECVRIGTNAVVLVRTVDAFGRLAGGGREGASQQTIGYATANRPATVSDPSLTVTYAYTPDGYEAGGSSVFSGGAAIRREVYRDPFRPNLVLSVSNYVNNALASFYDYAHDALGQSIRCNDDSFTYDSRRQLTSSLQPSQTPQTFSYDHIGNFTETVDVNGTNVWTANAVNQYASVGETAFSYTRDGGLSSDGRFDYAYDSGVRLTSVSTGGVTLATFAYDALDRRVRKTTPEATHFYFYDGWNLVLERIERLDGTVDEIEYFWGKDFSGSFGTAGGVGGLLYLRENGMEYAPLYDANGNVMQYVDRTGAVVASYVYDAFGRTLAATGPLADRFRFRFSTKYHDPETGLVYYGYRFYAPAHARWLTPDPLEEQGGLNLYAFCANNPVNGYDALGLITFPIPYDNVKLFWWGIAEYYVRRYKGWPISAHLLELSLVGFDRTAQVDLSYFGTFIGAVKDSQEYKKYINLLIEIAPSGRRFAHHEKTAFMSGDLYAAARKATIYSDGIVCKHADGSATLALDMKLEDEYDFHWWGFKEFRDNSIEFYCGNNLAFLSQYLYAIVPYKWCLKFTESGRWVQ